MEKYSRWRDKGTGIQPFLPDKPPARPVSWPLHILGWLRNAFLQAPIFVLRVVFLLIVGFWFLFMNAILLVLLVAPPLHRGFKKYISFLGCRAILLFMGFWWIDHAPASKVRHATPDQLSLPKIQSGDLIIANHISFVELFYLNFRFSPTFAFPVSVSSTSETDKTGFVVAYTFFGALRRFFSPEKRSPSEPILLSNLLASAKYKRLGPVVLFPEGITSNGKAVMQFLPVNISGIPSDVKVILMSFSFEYEMFSPAYVVGGVWQHFFKICFQFSNKLVVRTLVEHETPEFSKVSSHEEWLDGVSALIANISELRRVKLGYLDKQEFLAYWRSQQPGYAESKSQPGKMN